MISLQQFDQAEETALNYARNPELEWDVGVTLFFVLRDNQFVLANPYEREIAPGEVFIGFRCTSPGEVHPAMTNSRCVQVMGADQDSAEVHHIEGDYLSASSIRILGYKVDAGQVVIAATTGAKYTIMMFGSVLGTDDSINAVQPAVLRGEDGNIVIASIGGWLRTIGVR